MKDFEYSYYNEEIKNRFIEEKSKVRFDDHNYIQLQFHKLSEYEYDFCKDLCNWTVYEIVETYKMLNMVTFESLIILNNLLSQYTQFCLENSIVNDNQNHYLEINNEMISKCINKAVFDKKIVDRNTVMEWVRSLPNPRDQFILLSLFEFGKSENFKDIVYLKHSDCHGNQLDLSGRTVTISDEFKYIIDECIEENKYYSMTGKMQKISKLIDHGYVLKSYTNQKIDASDFQKGRNVYMSCKRIFSFLGIEQWMTPNAVSESGKIHMIKRRAAELNISPKEYIYSDHLKELENQFGNSILKHVFLTKYKEFLGA